MFHPLGNQQDNFGSQEGPFSEVAPPLLHLPKMTGFEPEKVVSSNPNLIL